MGRGSQTWGDHLTILVLDNIPIHCGIDDETRKRWVFEHNRFLLYLLAYSPELNLIEMIWNKAKYHCRRFINWRKETPESEPEKLLGTCGDSFIVNVY
ncbi:transposase [Salmonella enterica]|uniref:transposase n=1 Tax=Salmonella enterica TaxID=28901 RepID=UPI001F35AD1A|nr:transposase [Salmonella enterica]